MRDGQDKARLENTCHLQVSLELNFGLRLKCHTGLLRHVMLFPETTRLAL
jgi:hypothetical protein